MRKLLTEFLGTMFLAMTIGLVVTSAHPQPALVIGSVLMVAVYMGGHVSGAHYNPAISLAIFLRGRLAARDLGPYMAAQVLGATAGAGLSYLLLGSSFAPAPAATAKTMSALGVEVIFTLLLGLVVLNVATSKGTTGNSFYGLAIGFTILVGASVGGPISGGAFNPAIGVGPTAIHALCGGGTWSHLWLYLLGPFVGGAAAAVVFRFQEGSA